MTGVSKRGTTGDDFMVGTFGGDRLNGNRGEDLIFGLSGNDNISGGDGNDTVYGGSGNDRINGDYSDEDDGNDIISGGHGNDTLEGGDGYDLFVFYKGETGHDIIEDFDNDDDKIDLVSYNVEYSDLRFVQNGDDTVIYVADQTKITLENYDDSLNRWNFRLEASDSFPEKDDDYFYSGMTDDAGFF